MKKSVIALTLLMLFLPILAFATSTPPDNWEQVLAEKDVQIVELTEKLELLQGQIDALTATPAPTAEPTPAAYSLLKKGSKGDAVLALQERLKELGYLGGKSDGSFGGGTTSALKDFQKVAGLPEIGEADVDTQAALFAENAPKSPNPVMDESVYEKLDYKANSRDPEGYTGKLIKFSGKILQVIEGESEGMVSFRIASKGSYDNVLYAAYVIPEGYKRFLEDDKVMVYGVSTGIYSYETVRGDTISIPSCIVNRIELK